MDLAYQEMISMDVDMKTRRSKKFGGIWGNQIWSPKKILHEMLQWYG